MRRLQALGYVGAFAPVTTKGATADPKDHVAEYRQYRERFNRALGLLGRGGLLTLEHSGVGGSTFRISLRRAGLVQARRRAVS